ncbi:DUF5719 family protein [Demequina capsici]|uniref:DUF5719 family protein n=1 Tax=Demequina capsici TaxID=3075620 RepID=A0AA96FE16_9MICO|nr:DUF5719 family protein [Demequina sp. PMTSA13]WNM26720.1 DUF5719 family protein [Demequina sp. PMTSA13]
MRYAAAFKAGTALVAGGLLAGVALVGGALAPAVTAAPEPGRISVTPALPSPACVGELTVPVGAVEGDDFASEPTQRTRALFGAHASTDSSEVVDGAFGASIERIADGDIASYAALTCVRPATTQWLVGGSTALGSSARLVLSNPTDANVEATVTIYGGTGVLAEQRVLAIGAGQVEEMFLEGIQEGVDALAVKVDSTGAGVVAAIEDSRLDGLQPAGTTWIAPTDTLGTSLVIPAVGAGDLDSSAVLRMIAPDGATVSLTLVDASGVVGWSGVSDLVLDPGVVTDIEVPQSAVGAVEITSDAPLAAAAQLTVSRASTIGAAGSVATDRTWVSAEQMPSSTGEDPVLGVYAPGAGGAIMAYTPVATRLTLVDDTGAAVAEVQTSARAVTRIPLDDVAAGTLLQLQGRAAWSVLITAQPGFIASMRPAPTTVAPVDVDLVDGPYLP